MERGEKPNWFTEAVKEITPDLSDTVVEIPFKLTIAEIKVLAILGQKAAKVVKLESAS